MTLTELEELERQRQQKAAPRTEISPSIQQTVEEHIERVKQKFISNPIQQEPFSEAQRLLRIVELTSAANIPARHFRKTGLDILPHAAGEWNDALRNLKSKIGTGFLVALIGTRGTGKTQMGVELIRTQINRLKSAQFTTAMDIFLAVKSSYRKDGQDERVIVAEFCKPRLLVIDEIQERAETPWEDRILTHLIDRRYNDEKDTLLIGNLTPDQFAQHVGASILSRLNETGGIVQCDWESFRK
jgi:DNA replication protein DnaC